MMRTKLDLSKIEYELKTIYEQAVPSGYSIGWPDFSIASHEFISFTFWDKKGNRLYSTWRNSNTITYTEKGIKTLNIQINIESLLKANVLNEKDTIYDVIIKILTSGEIPYNISVPSYEVTTLGDNERKYIGPTADEVIKHALITVLGSDLALNIKLKCDILITFGDIEHADNIEIREQALRKFGYERYVEEGFSKNVIKLIILKKGIIPKDIIYPSANFPNGYYGYSQGINKEYTHALFRGLNSAYLYNKEKIIQMSNGISFLQVQDSSTDKIYFLKIPPNITDIQEAKAWTFGLEKEEYAPLVET